MDILKIAWMKIVKGGLPFDNLRETMSIKKNNGNDEIEEPLMEHSLRYDQNRKIQKI